MNKKLLYILIGLVAVCVISVIAYYSYKKYEEKARAQRLENIMNSTNIDFNSKGGGLFSFIFGVLGNKTLVGSIFNLFSKKNKDENQIEPKDDNIPVDPHQPNYA